MAIFFIQDACISLSFSACRLLLKTSPKNPFPIVTHMYVYLGLLSQQSA